MSASVSFSSSSNLSLHPPPPSSPNSSILPMYTCLGVTVGSHIFTALCCSYILFFLPLCIYVVHLGLQRWRRRRSASAATTTNVDLFTYNIVAMEMVGVFGCCFYCFGVYSDMLQIKMAGVYIFSIVSPGQTFFHILTCVERYLAVIHPVFFLGLRKAGVVRLVNCSTGLVWVMSFGWVGLAALYSPNFPIVPFAILLIFSFIVVSFFSVPVLRTLIRPGPGEGGGGRERVDQLKKRAIHTIMAITMALFLRFGGQLVCALVVFSAAVSQRDGCVVMLSGNWFCLPSSYVLPLLFLHRAGKLHCFKRNTKSDRGSE